MTIVLSFALILLAGLCEIAARYLAWQWLRAGWRPLFGVTAVAAIFVSLILPIFQGERFQFGRSTASYGVLFVVLSLLWSWWIDKKVPDFFDIVGTVLCITGISIMMYWPRK